MLFEKWKLMWQILVKSFGNFVHLQWKKNSSATLEIEDFYWTWQIFWKIFNPLDLLKKWRNNKFVISDSKELDYEISSKVNVRKNVYAGRG